MSVLQEVIVATHDGEIVFFKEGGIPMRERTLKATPWHAYICVCMCIQATPFNAAMRCRDTTMSP